MFIFVQDLTYSKDVSRSTIRHLSAEYTIHFYFLMKIVSGWGRWYDGNVLPQLRPGGQQGRLHPLPWEGMIHRRGYVRSGVQEGYERELEVSPS